MDVTTLAARINFVGAVLLRSLCMVAVAFPDEVFSGTQWEEVDDDAVLSGSLLRDDDGMRAGARGSSGGLTTRMATAHDDHVRHSAGGEQPPRGRGWR